MIIVLFDLGCFFCTELINQSDAVFIAVTVKRLFAVGRTQVCYGDDFHVFGWMLRNQHAAFITCPDESDFDRFAFELFVTKIGSA